MTDSFKFELVSPERLLFADDVQSVVVPGSEGEMTVLARHAPLMTSLRAGVLQVVGGNGSTRRIFVRGGFADIGAAGLTVLAEEAMAVEDIDRAKIEDELKGAEMDLSAAKSDEARMMAQAKLSRLKDIASAH